MKTWFKILPGAAFAAALFLASCDKQQDSVSPAETAEPTYSKGSGKTTVDAPTLSSPSSTQSSISITVTAGASGAPAGFSLQWMTAADYSVGPDGIGGTADDNSWYASDDLRLCKASFSGNANLSRYNLAPNEAVTVSVGDFLMDNGASTNCSDAMPCGVQYVFRAFAHANSNLNRSPFTANLYAATLPCGTTDTGCTYTQGYWKTHGYAPTGNNTNQWGMTSMQLGTVTYTDAEMQAIFNTPVQGNGLVAMAHQLMAAKLNIAHGAASTAIAATIVAADNMIGTLVIAPVGTGSLPSSTTSGLTDALRNYNEGATGPGHCPETGN